MKNLLQMFNKFTRTQNIKLRTREATYAYDEVSTYLFTGGITRFCLMGRDVAYVYRFEEGIYFRFYGSEQDLQFFNATISNFSKVAGVRTFVEIDKSKRPLYRTTLDGRWDSAGNDEAEKRIKEKLRACPVLAT